MDHHQADSLVQEAKGKLYPLLPVLSDKDRLKLTVNSILHIKKRIRKHCVTSKSSQILKLVCQPLVIFQQLFNLTNSHLVHIGQHQESLDWGLYLCP